MREEINSKQDDFEKQGKWLATSKENLGNTESNLVTKKNLWVFVLKMQKVAPFLNTSLYIQNLIFVPFSTLHFVSHFMTRYQHKILHHISHWERKKKGIFVKKIKNFFFLFHISLIFDINVWCMIWNFFICFLFDLILIDWFRFFEISILKFGIKVIILIFMCWHI